LGTLVSSLNTSLGDVLKREARDLDELFHATMESALANFLFLIAISSFSFAVLQVINGIGSAAMGESTSGTDIPTLNSGWSVYQAIVVEGAALTSFSAALVALIFFVRLVVYQRTVVKSIAKLPSPPESVLRINRIANVQTIVTMIQCVASGGSMASLILGFINRWSWLDTDKGNEVFFLSIASLVAWGLGIGLSLFVDFVMLYHLDPSVGKDICRSYWGALVTKHNQYQRGHDKYSVQSPAILDRNSWEYTAREFLTETRFDTVLGADRFNAIMQSIQSGDKVSWGGKALYQR